MIILNDNEREVIFSLAEELTGCYQKGNKKCEIFINNIIRRMEETSKLQLNDYLNYSSLNDNEFAHLLSSLTIHTTDWFREISHYHKLPKLITNIRNKNNIKKIKILSAACATGEEAYSIALVCELYKEHNNGFDYCIDAFDIDPICIEIAQKAIYSDKIKSKINVIYDKYININFFKKDEFTLVDSILNKVNFFIDNLLILKNIHIKYDIIFCRNILIYFEDEKIDLIIKQFNNKINKNGYLILGHSETLNINKYSFTDLTNAIYNIK